ncbi:UDP-xylose and UDP-N-acetylglucosamine transporter-like [Penaeus chinensis]|uniref:UDP-xylose and UDP-N-acetylglucosamine transporter-like n=1 Tax=Penaeus chinensis TaxID=139456 RepID=UPI001FB714DE|nr:UDP-xylose and UDP-N-acetylglucosamine transporter-like [Penaeus chinensis]XP_047502651.1 UDP-xylose and UDP-N-acetylglucosamine transporter-like [Penaeus chinensis]
MGAAAAVFLVFLGCCSNVIFLELLVKNEPGSGNIITCAQFVFIAIEGYIFTSEFGRKKNVIPIKDYMVLVIMFFIVNVTNNLAFGFKISMPLHMIFRSGGLIANMIMAIIVLGRRYTFSKYLSVAMITMGTAICTFASADNLKDSDEGEETVEGISNFMTWLLGIGLLTFALFLSARMGIFQECLYSQYGKHPREALYYIHMLSLPGFLLTSGSIIEHAIKYSSSEPLLALQDIPVLDNIPKLWIFLMGNMLTQYVCISSVFTLTSECTSLTVTLVLTLRKFLSLIFSIIYFVNPFTLYHWVGALLVFSGTLLFTDFVGKVRETFGKSTVKEE